jgi:type IV pilus assembly protein PilC
MPVYQYVARNPQGQVVTGSAEAAHQGAIAKQLRDQGLVPTSIQLRGAVAAARRRAGKRGGVKTDDLAILSRQMATMIRAGLPLIEVLDVLAEQSERRIIQSVMRRVEKDVEGGASLTEAIQKYPKIFRMFFISMVRAGEASGMLDTVLDQVAIYLEKLASIQRKMKSAVVYPVVVSIVAVCITTFLLVKVVPVFEQIFEGLHGTLPLPTRITMGVSRGIIHYWYIILIVLVGGVIGLVQWKRTKSGRYAIDRLKLKIPVFGPLFLKVAIAKFSRTLGTLIRAGVNILQALDIVAKTAGNALIEEAVYRTRVSIQSGESITRPLVESNVFPPMVTRMIDVGERTGALETMLNKIADFYEDQVSATVAALTSLIEPILIVFLGCIVGFIVISMFLPLIKMVELVSTGR